MRNIIIFMGRYLPGYKDGGPIRTITNLVDHLGTEYNFFIVTNDRDRDSQEPYENISFNCWNNVGNAKVFYVQPGKFNAQIIKQLIEGKDLIYCCGPYDNYARILLSLKNRNQIKQPLVIAAMGTFTNGALSQKSLKKRMYFKALKLSGVLKKVVWSVSTELEQKDLFRTLGKCECFIAENLPRKISERKLLIQKEAGNLKLVFLSRIHPHKNLTYALDILKKVHSQVTFDIYGPKQDEEYWQKCEKLIEKMPDNICVRYKGSIDGSKVIEVLEQYHAFILPTWGENFGHVICEALMSGCIPVISNTTPWTELAVKNCGYVLSLNEPQKFTEAIEHIAQLDQNEYIQMRNNAISFIEKKNNYKIENTGYRKIFDYGMRK